MNDRGTEWKGWVQDTFNHQRPLGSCGIPTSNEDMRRPHSFRVQLVKHPSQGLLMSALDMLAALKLFACFRRKPAEVEKSPVLLFQVIDII